MYYFLQQLINGLTLGSVYGLIAIGYTMVYGIIGMINFAHGEIYMVGAFISVIAFAVLGLAGITQIAVMLIVVLVTSLIVTSLYGWSIERIAYRPLRNAPRLAPLISAIGMSILLQNYVQLLQGARVKTIAPVLTGSFTLMERADGFAVSISVMQIIILAMTTALMLGVTMLVQRTSLGRAQRACEQDKMMAALVGINVDRTISTTFVIGAALAALAGFMVTLYYGVVDFFMGFLAGMKAFTAAVLGGIGSLPGAMLGGLMIGLVESFWSSYVNAQYKDVAVFGILMLVLLIRPNGFFGRAEIEKV
jgi:branched-chain amino acid transport system permease protein